MAGEKDELALGDVKGHVLQGQRTVRIGFVDVGETDHVRGKRERVKGLGSSSSSRLPFAFFSACSRSPMMSVRVLEATAQPEEPVGNADLGPAFGPDALVRGEPGLGDQRLHTGKAGGMGDQLEPLEQPLRALGPRP